MSENTEDVRTKITPEEHEFLSAVALGSREEMASILRRLIREFLDAKRHEYTVAARFGKAQGIVRESAGNREGNGS
jgi:hypothetical protein